MQELIEKLKVLVDNSTEQATALKNRDLLHSSHTSEAMSFAYQFAIDEANKLLQKEKRVIANSYISGQFYHGQNFHQTGEEYYNGMYN